MEATNDICHKSSDSEFLPVWFGKHLHQNHLEYAAKMHLPELFLTVLVRSSGNILTIILGVLDAVGFRSMVWCLWLSLINIYKVQMILQQCWSSWQEEKTDSAFKNSLPSPSRLEIQTEILADTMMISRICFKIIWIAGEKRVCEYNRVGPDLIILKLFDIIKFLGYKGKKNRLLTFTNNTS